MSNIPTRLNGEIIFAEHMNSMRDEIDALATNPINIINNYTAENTYRLIIADPQSNTIDITLPDPAVNEGRSYLVKTLETGATFDLSFAVTVVGSVDGDTNLVVEENKQSFRLVSNGTTWVVV